MNILVINGPNMNMLGIRQPEIYGRATYEDLKAMVQAEADKLGVTVSFFQSNHEGALVDAIQQAYFDHVDGIIINPAAYTHTSVALLDAVKAVGIPTVCPLPFPWTTVPVRRHRGACFSPGMAYTSTTWKPAAFFSRLATARPRPSSWGHWA